MEKKTSDKARMSFKELFSVYPVTFFAIAVSLVLCFVTFFYNYKIALGELAVIIVLLIFALTVRNLQFKRMLARINACESFISAENGLENFSVPVALFGSDSKIMWCNSAFRKKIVANTSPESDSITQFTGGIGAEKIREKDTIECEYNGKCYTAFHSFSEYKKEMLYALYFVEDTELKAFRLLYKNSRPVVMFMTFDFAEENYRNMRESQVSEIISGVEGLAEKWFTKYDCLIRKLGNGKLMLVTDVQNAEKMKADKFSVLSEVRNYTYGGKTAGITLSVGASGGKNIAGCEFEAKQALDMALGRGGDQVAFKNGNNDYKFFGGVSQSSEKRTKVRARMVASAVRQIIEGSDNVLVMGHRNSDLDAVGAAVGVAEICASLNKECKIVIDKDTTLASPLISHLSGTHIENKFISPIEAENLAGENTLLIIVDTHRASFLETPQIFDAVSKVIVIDHHRKTVDHISKAVVFYHEPNASSASEMVTELIEYMQNGILLTKPSAEALLSGIMLDTKNFVMKTGVATFEAAAYLRAAGADTVSVKRLFSNSLKTQKEKSEVVKNAVMFGGSAVGVVDFESENVRIIAGQAADELLGVDGVEASYILFRTGSVINISARSYGKVNVQLVMENMGGGGHRTMAACQIPDISFEDALSRLKKSIKAVKLLNE